MCGLQGIKAFIGRKTAQLETKSRANDSSAREGVAIGGEAVMMGPTPGSPARRRRPRMTSPFPGMDPYLEAHWGDVHASLITYARDQLRVQLPPDLRVRVRVEERVAVEVDSGENGPAGKRRRFYPDVRVMEQPRGGGAPG